MYPNLRGGWRVALHAAIRHHNRSRCSTIGCSPFFALNNEVPYLPADERFNIRQNVRLTENRFSPEEEEEYRNRQEKHYNKRHSNKIPKFAIGDDILVQKGQGKQSKFYGPFKTLDLQFIDGTPKTFTHSAAHRFTSQKPGITSDPFEEFPQLFIAILSERIPLKPQLWTFRCVSRFGELSHL